MNNTKFKTKITTKVPFQNEDRLRFDESKTINDPNFCMNDSVEMEVELTVISDKKWDVEWEFTRAYIEREDGSNMSNLQAIHEEAVLKKKGTGQELSEKERKYIYKQQKFKYLTDWEMNKRFIKESDPRLKSH
jgi:hypothetical protein